MATSARAATRSSLARARASAACSSAMRLWRTSAATSRTARPSEADDEQRGESGAERAERARPGEQALDQLAHPQAEAERDEPAEARPDERRRASGASARATPERCAASTARSASSIGSARACFGNGGALRANGRGRRHRRRRVVDGDALVVEPEGARARAMFAHASLSPMRNCSARSRRMCGAGAPRAVTGGRKRTKRQSLSASGRASASPANDRLGVFGQFAGKDRRLGDAVEDLAVELLARLGHADDRLQRFAGVANLGLARRADRGERDRRRSRRRPLRRARSPCRSTRAGSPPAGRGWRDADGRPWSRRTGCGRCAGGRSRRAREARPARNACITSVERVFQIAQRRGAGIQRAQRVDQHDLPVEAGRSGRERTAAPHGSYRPRSAAPSSPPASAARFR